MLYSSIFNKDNCFYKSTHMGAYLFFLELILFLDNFLWMATFLL